MRLEELSRRANIPFVELQSVIQRGALGDERREAPSSVELTEEQAIWLVAAIRAHRVDRRTGTDRRMGQLLRDFEKRLRASTEFPEDLYLQVHPYDETVPNTSLRPRGSYSGRAKGYTSDIAFVSDGQVTVETTIHDNPHLTYIHLVEIKKELSSG